MEPGKRVENQQNINSRIINLVKIRGPILPIHASKETGQNLLLTGAFLSSLVSDKTLRISNLKVGGSPLYYLPGQEAMLENFIKFLNNKEREAYAMIKEKKVLKDNDLNPDIRVAIKNIKDFAKSFSLNSQPNEIFWRFFSVNDQELETEMNNYRMIKTPAPEEKIEIQKQTESISEIKPEIKIEEPKPAEAEIEEPKIEQVLDEKLLEKKIETIFEKTPEKTHVKTRKPRAKLQSDKFLEEIKPLLTGKNLEIVKIEKSDKKEITLIAKQNEKEIFILALNKKRIEESDLLKAFRKSQVLKLPYLILSKGEMPKKLKEIMEASRGLDRIEKI